MSYERKLERVTPQLVFNKTLACIVFFFKVHIIKKASTWDAS